MSKTEAYPYNLLETFEAQKDGPDELQLKRMERGERSLDYQSAEMIAIGGLDKYCVVLQTAESEAS